MTSPSRIARASRGTGASPASLSAAQEPELGEGQGAGDQPQGTERRVDREPRGRLEDVQIWSTHTLAVAQCNRSATGGAWSPAARPVRDGRGGEGRAPEGPQHGGSHGGPVPPARVGQQDPR